MNEDPDTIEVHYFGISNRNKRIDPFKATYKLAWTSNIAVRGKLGLEVLGDSKPEDSAEEKKEVVSITKEVLAAGIVLDRGKLTTPMIRQIKGQLLYMRHHEHIQEVLKAEVPNTIDVLRDGDDCKSDLFANCSSFQKPSLFEPRSCLN